jgi:hypothetical protein
MRTLPLFAFLALTSPVLSQGPAIGDKVADVTFPTLINGDGRQSLAEFFGQPVVIDQWGIH